MNLRTIAAAFSALVIAGSVIAAPSFAQDKMSGDKMSAPKMSKMQDKKVIAVTTGQFKQVTHATKGTATIYEKPDGSRELRLTGFSTADGPALHLYLVAAEDAKDNESVTKAGFIDLGPIKKGKASQTFKVPAKIDLWKYLAATVWCAKFNVNFGTAPLASAQK
jgi:hypothetical protein